MGRKRMTPADRGEDTRVGAGDAEEATVCYSLDSGVKKRSSSAVRIEVDNVVRLGHCRMFMLDSIACSGHYLRCKSIASNLHFDRGRG